MAVNVVLDNKTCSSRQQVLWAPSAKTFCCIDQRDGATIYPLHCFKHCLNITWNWISHLVTKRQCTWGKGQGNDTYSGSDNFKPLNQHLYLPTSGLLGLRKIKPYLSHYNSSFLLLKTFITDTLIHWLIGLKESCVRWRATYLKIHLAPRDLKKPVN